MVSLHALAAWVASTGPTGCRVDLSIICTIIKYAGDADVACAAINAWSVAQNHFACREATHYEHAKSARWTAHAMCTICACANLDGGMYVYSSGKCKPDNVTFETAVPQDGRIEIAGGYCWTFDRYNLLFFNWQLGRFGKCQRFRKNCSLFMLDSIDRF